MFPGFPLNSSEVSVVLDRKIPSSLTPDPASGNCQFISFKRKAPSLECGKRRAPSPSLSSLLTIDHRYHRLEKQFARLWLEDDIRNMTKSGSDLDPHSAFVQFTIRGPVRSNHRSIPFSLRHIRWSLHLYNGGLLAVYAIHELVLLISRFDVGRHDRDHQTRRRSAFPEERR